MKKEQQMLIIIGVCVLAYIYIFLKVLIGPVNARISKAKKIISEKTAELQQAKMMTASLPQLKRETDMLKLEIEDLEKKLPRKVELPELIKIISREAQNYGIKIQTLARQSIDTSAPQFNEIPFSVSFTANFHSLGQFLVDLAQGERIISSRDLVLSYTGDKTNSVNGTCVIFGYTLK